MLAMLGTAAQVQHPPLGLTYTRLVHLDVEDCSEELLRQQSYAIKTKLGHPKPLEKLPTLGVFCMLLAGSLWHKDSWLPCTERSWAPELVLYMA